MKSQVSELRTLWRTIFEILCPICRRCLSNKTVSKRTRSPWIGKIPLPMYKPTFPDENNVGNTGDVDLSCGAGFRVSHYLRPHTDQYEQSSKHATACFDDHTTAFCKFWFCHKTSIEQETWKILDIWRIPTQEWTQTTYVWPHSWRMKWCKCVGRIRTWSRSKTSHIPVNCITAKRRLCT